MVMSATPVPANYQPVVFQPDSYLYPESGELLNLATPTFEQLWQQANELDSLGRYSEVLIVLNQIIELYPESFQAWHWQGNIWASLGNYEDAIAAYEQAIKIKPNYFLAAFERGILQVFRFCSQFLLRGESL